MVQPVLKTTLFLLTFILSLQNLFAQPQVQPWGNMQGIRIDGQLMPFETSLSVVKKNWSTVQSTGKERQNPSYMRKGSQQIIATSIDSFYFKETINEAGKGNAKVSVQLNAKAAASIEGVYFTLSVADEYYADGSIQVNNLAPIKLSAGETALATYLQTPATSVQFISSSRQVKIIFTEATSVSLKKNKDKGFKGMQLFIPLLKGDVINGQSATKDFTIKTNGVIDKNPVTFALDTATTGRAFDGLGGNFRLQNQQTDPQVIDYCLENLRVAWGRVDMPWRFWQPAIDSNPIVQAKAGKLNMQVQKAMEMAQRLHTLGMPVILTAWSAPAWAVVGVPKFRPGADGVWGNPLDTSKTAEIYTSIADYIDYVKEQYGFEISLFSFNESDLGINIRQTGEEHATLIKGLGAYFVSRGIKTKLLLGDNSDATTYEFINPALNDVATHPYIGAISFHSWRGWDTETLQKWAAAATKLHLPLLVGEGSIDAAAWAYPAIFDEQIYALEEISLYIRLLAICQPASILQWQLTADYSPLAGGGIFGDTSALRPLQRFWNLKQLASTPKSLQAMPLKSTAKNVSAAAFGDNKKGIYTLHFVNNGASRKAIITGLPVKIKSLRLWVTDKQRPMKAGALVPVVNGKAVCMLEATSFTTLISN